jgi:ATP-dependent Lon protease
MQGRVTGRALSRARHQRGEQDGERPAQAALPRPRDARRRRGPGVGVRLALECRRRVKEQQKRIGAAEFRNTHFSYVLGLDGVEKFVSTPELIRARAASARPAGAGQVWASAPAARTRPPGSTASRPRRPGQRREDPQPPGPHRLRGEREVRRAEPLRPRRELVGDRDPRGHEFSVQLRAFDASQGRQPARRRRRDRAVQLAAEEEPPRRARRRRRVNLGGSVEPLQRGQRRRARPSRRAPRRC